MRDMQLFYMQRWEDLCKQRTDTATAFFEDIFLSSQVDREKRKPRTLFVLQGCPVPRRAVDSTGDKLSMVTWQLPSLLVVGMMGDVLNHHLV